MTQKKKLYSLLAILLSVTLLVTGIICALIFWLAQQSTQNFENFIVESRQQEIDSAVHSFSTDVDTLLLLMQTELNDSALTRLQLYYDSRIFNYDYLSQTTAVRNQISIIENSMPFTETLGNLYVGFDAQGRVGLYCDLGRRYHGDDLGDAWKRYQRYDAGEW